MQIGDDDVGRMQWWVDALYAVHPDMVRSNAGGVLSFVRGELVCKSSQQKLNTKSPAKVDVVGASNYLPNTLWVKMFMKV